MSAWLWLIFAGLCEVVWAGLLKSTDGFSKLWPSMVCVLFMVLSVYGLAIAQKTLPLGTSYAVWVGIGIVGASILGMIMFGEPRTLIRFACIGLILAGIVGLKLTGATSH
jgi:quaternary ammonium compound-resistance protein SugE